jgi:hypothetical protein
MDVQRGWNRAWAPLCDRYFAVRHRQAKAIPNYVGTPLPNSKLSGWEDTPWGRQFVLRNVDRDLMRFSEKAVERIVAR